MIVVGIVDEYRVNNVHTDYDDGTFEWFDTTRLYIVEPVEVAGRVMNIDHNNPQPAGSPWRENGAILRLELGAENAEELTRANIEWFSDGIRILSHSHLQR